MHLLLFNLHTAIQSSGQLVLSEERKLEQHEKNAQRQPSSRQSHSPTGDGCFIHRGKAAITITHFSRAM